MTNYFTGETLQQKFALLYDRHVGVPHMGSHVFVQSSVLIWNAKRTLHRPTNPRTHEGRNPGLPDIAPLDSGLTIKLSYSILQTF